MRKLVLFMHTSLDGFVAGPNGEMHWVTVTDDVFDYAKQRTDAADTALYGRNTYEMMQGYWPTAGDQPNATAHDREHSAWYNRVAKVIVSNSMRGTKLPNTTIVGARLTEEINAIKSAPGADIVMFGSPTAAHALSAANLIDEYWLMVNPVLIGSGIPLFKGIQGQIPLTAASATRLPSGVVALQYEARPVS
jgi:dihydrofolate reductase